ncbi:hypothetical protein Ciccas_005228 [Cichlidogyrus casuarinus]|uniref:Dystrophin n=1 Tax=Cichlidogyrus casuarinus TaxID=1844966 RepID=A0ABD2Q997_9PLAT
MHEELIHCVWVGGLQRLLNTDKVMEAIDQYVEELAGTEKVLSQLNLQAESRPPDGAVEAVRNWLHYSREEWTASERRRLILLLDNLNTRQAEWQNLSSNSDQVASWLSQADNVIKSGHLPADQEFLSTAQARAHLSNWDHSERLLGSNIDSEYSNLRCSFSDRLDSYDAHMHTMRQQEEAKKQQKLDRLMKANRDLQDGLAHINTWTDNVAKKLAGDPSAKPVTCSLPALNEYKKQLEGLLSEHRHVNKELNDSRDLLHSILQEDNELSTSSSDARHNEIALSAANLNNTKTKIEDRILGIRKISDKLNKLEGETPHY